MNLSDFPEEVIDQYKLQDIATADGIVFTEIRMGMYDLPAAGILSNRYLEQRLNEYRFYQSNFTNGLWTHKSRPIQFALAVDDFGVKYTNEADVNYLLDALTAIDPNTGKPMYEVSTDWSGHKFCGLTMDWDYKNEKFTFPCLVMFKRH